MSRKIPVLIGCAVILAGVMVAAYPYALKEWNVRGGAAAIESYAADVEIMSAEEKDELWRGAEEFNDKLRMCADEETLREINDEYRGVLDVDGDGMMGYIGIPKIEVYLPIYHGSDEETLAKGIGHVENSSFPVGGESTHVVLAGHRAEAGADYFKDLDMIEIGDTFTLYVLGEELTYEVDRIFVVLPEEKENLFIVEGEDYCTLVTCTPYGSESHRLLVRGRRVE